MSRRSIKAFIDHVHPNLKPAAQERIDENARRLNASKLCDAVNDLLDPATMKFGRADAEKCFRDAVFRATGIRIRSLKRRFAVLG